jgi:hypothetical protein
VVEDAHRVGFSVVNCHTLLVAPSFVYLLQDVQRFQPLQRAHGGLMGHIEVRHHVLRGACDLYQKF